MKVDKLDTIKYNVAKGGIDHLGSISPSIRVVFKLFCYKMNKYAFRRYELVYRYTDLEIFLFVGILQVFSRKGV